MKQPSPSMVITTTSSSSAVDASRCVTKCGGAAGVTSASVGSTRDSPVCTYEFRFLVAQSSHLLEPGELQ